MALRQSSGDRSLEGIFRIGARAEHSVGDSEKPFAVRVKYVRRIHRVNESVGTSRHAIKTDGDQVL